MVCCFRFIFVFIVLAAFVFPAGAAPPSACSAQQERIKTLQQEGRKAAGKEAIQKRVELENLLQQYKIRCEKENVGNSTTPAPSDVRLPSIPGQQAETPEEEIKRRRDALNQKGLPVSKPLASGGKDRATAVRQVIPLEGSVLIEGRAASTFYGQVRQEITYTIRESFVGNLIVTRWGGAAAGKEDYVIQTLSTEIDVEHFKGRGCAKYGGSPPVCSKWLPIDLWQIDDGEEYPGRTDGVVSATSDSRNVMLRVDGPDIDFGSSQGAVSLRSGCADQLREVVSRDEFKQWLRRSTMRIKREAGKSVPNCQPGSSLTLELRFGPEP